MFTKCLFPVYKSHISAIWRTVDHSKLLSASERFATPNVEIIRFKARKGTREKKFAANQARKLANARKAPPISKYLPKKVKVSAELERRRCTDENWLETQPIDNVWNMKLYRGKPNSLLEAIKILRDLHIPSLLNDPSAILNLTIEIDLKLKKKDRFMDGFNGVLTFPREFDTPKKNKIVVVCKESEEQIKASEAGALYTGSASLIKQILTGTLASDEFDYVVCHPDMYKELNVLRGILKRKFPNTNNGLLRLDIQRAVTSFIKGVEYEMKRSALEPDFGWVDVCCGRINMPLSEVEENVRYALSTIENHKPNGISHLFIVRVLLWCERSRERLKIPHWEYVPNYPENGILVENEEQEAVEAS